MIDCETEGVEAGAFIKISTNFFSKIIPAKGKNERQIIISEFIKVHRSELSLINLSDLKIILPATGNCLLNKDKKL